MQKTISVEKVNDINEDNNNDIMHDHFKGDLERLSENNKKKSRKNEGIMRNATEM